MLMTAQGAHPSVIEQMWTSPSRAAKDRFNSESHQRALVSSAHLNSCTPYILDVDVFGSGDLLVSHRRVTLLGINPTRRLSVPEN